MTSVILTWQEFQAVVQTLDDERLEKVNAREILKLLNAHEYNDSQ